MKTLAKSEFKDLFDAALETAILSAEQRLKRKLARNILVLLHGAGHPGDLMSSAEALDALYLGTSEFYRIIDVAVIEVGQQHTKIFVRASSHHPTPFEQTWNDPPGSGPFKQLEAKDIKVLEG